MFTLDGIRQFHRWTHQSLALLLDHLASLSPSDYTRELPGFGYPSLRAQVVHLFGCEIRWLNRIRSLPQRDWNSAHWPTVADARAPGRRSGHDPRVPRRAQRSSAQHTHPHPLPRASGPHAHSGPHPAPRPHSCLSSQRPDRGHVPHPRPPGAHHRHVSVRIELSRTPRATRGAGAIF